jgi:hypothetical protein
MVRPWANAGFECFCVDAKHAAGEERRDGITWIGADVRDWLPPPRRYAIVFAAPPCTNLTVSSGREPAAREGACRSGNGRTRGLVRTMRS